MPRLDNEGNDEHRREQRSINKLFENIYHREYSRAKNSIPLLIARTTNFIHRARNFTPKPPPSALSIPAVMERAIISGLRSSSFSFLLNSIVEPREDRMKERRSEEQRNNNVVLAVS